MAAKNTTSVGLSASRMGEYILPSTFSSPRVSFHPSATGASARSSSIFEAAFGTIEGLFVMYKAESVVRFFAVPNTPVPPVTTSLMQLLGGCVIVFHVPLLLGVPNRRTNVESRLMLQTTFMIVESVAGAVCGFLALKGEEKTGLRSARMWLLSGAVAFFGAMRAWMVYRKEWPGAYLEESEDSSKKND